MCSCVFQGPLLSHDIVEEVSQRALTALLGKDSMYHVDWDNSTSENQRIRLLEELGGMLEMGAGKHLHQSAHAKWQACEDPNLGWGSGSQKAIHGQICLIHASENAPGQQGAKQVKAPEKNHGMNIFVKRIKVTWGG